MATRADDTGIPFNDESSDHCCVGRGITSPESDRASLQAMPETLGGRIRRRLFNRFGLLRSTAFRMAMLFWLLFAACFGIAAGITYENLQDRVLDGIDSAIDGQFLRIEELYESRGIDAVIQVGESRSRSPMESSMGFHLATIDGERVAGNVPVCLTELGWNIIKGRDLGLEGDDGVYRFFTGIVGGNLLSLGLSLDTLVELRKTAMSSLVWTGVVSMMLAFLVAAFFARRTHQRVAGISTALDGVGRGNLRARLPVTCAGDDIDCLSAKINSSLNHLEQTVNGMRQVSTDIAHDLKTPLNHLYITIEEAAAKSRSGACVGDDLDGALDEAQAINGTFEALLRIAQIEAGARKSQFREFGLVSVLETAAEVYSPVIDEQCQQLIVSLPTGKALPILGDERLIMQLVVNLIENAVHHCSENTVIELSAGENTSGVWFRVADSGPGIPDAEREKVFQRLYRLERSRTTSGTGLGLSLVKAIADLHGGRISLDDNRPGLVVTVQFENTE